jgi:hypothetical protein
MAYSLRLPAGLDADARARCDRLGISLNALLCVALDAYLRTPEDAPKQGKPGQGDISAVTGTEPDGTAQPSKPPPRPVLAAAIPKLSKAQRREITRLERASRKH